MRVIIVIFTFCLQIVAQANTPFLHRSNRLILDSTEKPIQLRGVNLGGWLMWEEWIWGGGFHSQTHVMDGLIQMTSKEDAEKFRDSIWLNYISENDLKKIAAAHFNVVRVPLNAKIFDETAEPSAYKGVGWKILDSVLTWCKRYGIYAIPDFHGAPGGQSRYFIADPDKVRLWSSEKDQQRFADLWKAIAMRYKNNSALGGYDLINEPIQDKKDQLVNMYEKIIAAIREVDQNHMVFIEGGNFAKDFTLFSKVLDPNMAFSFHFYNWFGGKPKNKLKNYPALSAKFNVPLWCGEWGENNYGVLETTRKVMEDPANGFSGWCFWTWKKVRNGYATLNEINCGENWKVLVEALKHKGKRKNISKEFALKAMHEFLKAIRFSNNATDEVLLKILSPF